MYPEELQPPLRSQNALLPANSAPRPFLKNRRLEAIWEKYINTEMTLIIKKCVCERTEPYIGKYNNKSNLIWIKEKELIQKFKLWSTK